MRDLWMLFMILVLASASQVNADSFLPSTDVGTLLYEHLDLKSFRSSFGPKRDNIHTLKNFVDHDCPDAKIDLRDQSVEVRCSDWLYIVRMIERGDFDGDNVEDLRVEFTDRALQGTYNTVSVVTLTRRQSNEALTFLGLKSEGRWAR